MRRRAVTWMAAGWLCFGLAGVTGAASAVRYFFPNVTFEPDSVFVAGHSRDFSFGPDRRFACARGVNIVRTPAGFHALSALCPADG